MFKRTWHTSDRESSSFQTHWRESWIEIVVPCSSAFQSFLLDSSWKSTLHTLLFEHFLKHKMRKSLNPELNLLAASEMWCHRSRNCLSGQFRCRHPALSNQVPPIRSASFLFLVSSGSKRSWGETDQLINLCFGDEGKVDPLQDHLMMIPSFTFEVRLELNLDQNHQRCWILPEPPTDTDSGFIWNQSSLFPWSLSSSSVWSGLAWSLISSEPVLLCVRDVGQMGAVILLRFSAEAVWCLIFRCRPQISRWRKNQLGVKVPAICVLVQEDADQGQKAWREGGPKRGSRGHSSTTRHSQTVQGCSEGDGAGGHRRNVLQVEEGLQTTWELCRGRMSSVVKKVVVEGVYSSWFSAPPALLHVLR